MRGSGTDEADGAREGPRAAAGGEKDSARWVRSVRGATTNDGGLWKKSSRDRRRMGSALEGVGLSGGGGAGAEGRT